jgi:hypothetical protein
MAAPATAGGAPAVPSARLVPFPSRVVLPVAIATEASDRRDHLYAAERPTVAATVDAGRDRVRTSLSTAARVMLMPVAVPTPAAVAAAGGVAALPPSAPSAAPVLTWASWTPAARAWRWRVAGNPSLGV